MLTHTQALTLGSETLTIVEKLKWKHIAQDQQEISDFGSASLTVERQVLEKMTMIKKA